MVACNSGRPGGSVGLRGKIDKRKVHAGHSTQEEDVVSAWMVAHTRGSGDVAAIHKEFCDTIDQQWGLVEDNGRGPATFQVRLFLRSRDPLLCFSLFVFVLNNVCLELTQLTPPSRG